MAHGVGGGGPFSIGPVPAFWLVGFAAISDGMVLILIVLNSDCGYYRPRQGLTLRVDSALGVFSSELLDVIE